MASAGSPVSPPDDDEDLAFAPAWKQADWIRTRRLTSERLTRVYLDRIERLGPRLECVVTATPELAIEQARRADRDLANGRYRGPLHGLPYGAKDLFDTAGISTTYGAEPYRERVPERTAVVIERLERAGAVLACKTTLGALAYGDIWFGGRTRNPFDLSQGSSGSSAGSSSGVVAGLFSFSLGTETLGSIVSPSMRCGAAGIRPTFGRVARTDSMELCWSLDKIGPICRTIADAALVLSVINGADAGDPSSVDAPFDCDLTRDAYGLRVGYRPEWFEGRGATEHDTAALAAVRDAGCELVEIDYEYQENFGALRTILNVEAAAAFEELTLSGRDEMLKWQQPQAWPNTFRSAWMVPAIELIQAQRIRRAACEYWDDQLARHGVDAVVAPSFAAGLLLLTNFTGTPCAVVRTGFRSETRPHGITVWGRSFGEAAAVKVAHEIERRLGAWETRPPIS
ncbi:MAG: amidase [Planctomycetota bacterium]